jgi:flavin-binding protein dodecin
MSHHVYKVVELVGSSKSSIEDAIQTAIKRADQTLRNLHWFEVVQTRGHVENGEVHHYQVVGSHAGSHVLLQQLTSTVQFRPVLIRSDRLGNSPKRP